MVDSNISRRGGSAVKRLVSPSKIIIYMALIIMALSAWTWWKYVYNNPDRVFWGMVNNNLSTTSFTKKVVQDDGQQQVTQVTATQTSPMQLSNSKTTIKQGEPQTAEVVTESIGTPTLDFVRYTKLQTSQKGANGNTLDFSKVLNTWGRSEPQGDKTNGQLYNESILGVVPYGNVNAKQRASLIDSMKRSNAYSYSVAKKSGGAFGRTMYTFNVELNPRGYIAALKEFAQAQGLNQFENVDPAQYQNAQPVTVQLTVDGWSHLLTQTSFSDGSRIEQMSGYGSLAKMTTPPSDKDSIPVDTLRERLSTIQ